MSLIELIEKYVECRHKYGAPEYNAKTAEAREAVRAEILKLNKGT